MAKAAKLGHVAFIMDGNGRWAQKRGMPREMGHKYGAEAMKRVLERCAEHGIGAVTFYAFSTENWKRSKNEVDSLMDLLKKYLVQLEGELDKNDIRYIFLGDTTPFSDEIRARIAEVEKKTEGKRFIVNIALNYGSRSELAYVCNKLIGEGKKNVTEADIDARLYTRESPSLDLIVRTGGDIRLSNFLLWQAAYAELYFTDTLWPDMNAECVDRAIEEFLGRKRRFGGV